MTAPVSDAPKFYEDFQPREMLNQDFGPIGSPVKNPNWVPIEPASPDLFSEFFPDF